MNFPIDMAIALWYFGYSSEKAEQNFKRKEVYYMPRNYNKLIGKIVEVFGTRAVFARQMNWSERTCSLKLNGKVDWRQDEMVKACDLLGIQHIDIPDYFFALEVQ